MKKDDLRLGAVVFAAVLLLVIGYVYFGDFAETPITGHVSEQVGNLSVGVQTVIACSWSNDALAVDFGANMNPGTNGTNGTGNNQSVGAGTMYNMTVAEVTTGDVNLSIKGNDLLSGANVLGVGNVTYQSNMTAANGTNMNYVNGESITDSYVVIESPVVASETVHYRFWIDIPTGLVAGDYVGNYTQMCTEA